MQEVDSPSPEEAVLPGRKLGRDGKLSVEIRMVRTLIRRAETLANEGKPLGDLLTLLESVSRASANLANLLKAEKALDESQSAADYVRAALDDIRADMERKGIDSVLTSGLG